MGFFSFWKSSKDLESSQTNAPSSQPQPPLNTTPESVFKQPSDSPAQSSSFVAQFKYSTSPSIKLLTGGSLFFALSILATRRAIRRRALAAIPPYYTAAVYHRPAGAGAGPFGQGSSSGAIDALEALNLATINVVSGAMVMLGGAMYATGVEGISDAQRLVRGAMGISGGQNGGTGVRSDVEVEEELEEWVAGVLQRKERKEAARARDGRRD